MTSSSAEGLESAGMVRVILGPAGFLWVPWSLGNLVGLWTLCHCTARLGILACFGGCVQGLIAGWEARSLAKRSQHAVNRLDLSCRGEVLVHRCSGERQRGRVGVGCRVSPFLVILYWREETGRYAEPVVLDEQSAAPEKLRKLRVLLRHPL
ncbi:hypothetical protein [Ferrovum myxofaciens]|uniref:Uncharacterized protein n=1 Tax=Ferrovum myxofaciens TaxID=416213 RepID=A0A9E6MW63_9PROT|nr:hypothetical protein [Ferrovum myxofaciens]MBU6994652.1 hypothetical protein [Ferrovum myxofaciens]QKE38506.1 MAG: hypothetical protein HO273_06990 [Ferrovum myxofaciens]QKE41041.1 MAG: hypothetical protein HO274_06775 [Ferrovum myxofaciens]QWY73697.1 MAG: hypothetical protein JVY19_07520 [Ferrovum myxofaciens]QWY76451.1 MAG: hypothetical protein JZL65_07980 [Ferrovum myxofaciens]